MNVLASRTTPAAMASSDATLRIVDGPCLVPGAEWCAVEDPVVIVDIEDSLVQRGGPGTFSQDSLSATRAQRPAAAVVTDNAEASSR